MNKCIILIVALTLISCNSELESLIFRHFQKFIKKYNKNYSSIEEYLSRYNIFRNNLMQTINSENKLYKTGITKFFDITKQEFSNIYSNFNLNFDTIISNNFYPSSVESESDEIPSEWDWREHGIVGKIRNIRTCDANWAFAIIGNLEALYARHYGTYEYFSPQMLIDCDPYDYGCSGGGLMQNTFNWIKENGGIMLESDYPYKSEKLNCEKDPSKYVKMKIIGYKKLGSQYQSWLSPCDENEMKELLYKNGPLIVALNSAALVTYRSGIIDQGTYKCPAEGVDIMALLVGYGYDESRQTDYWIVQNFWGQDWGEKGYFRIRRGIGTCNINSYVFTGLVSFE